MVFRRDEERSHSLLWFVSAMLFAGVSVWAVYDDQVTRAPWAAEQEEFFALERELAAKSLKAVQGRHRKASKGRLGELERRIAELEKKQAAPDYRTAVTRLAELDEKYADAESDKTFARSDQDEVYYYRTVAEYDVELASSRAQRGALEAEVQHLRAEEARHQRDIDRAAAAMERIDAQRRRLRAKIAPVDEALEEARRELTVLRREVEEAELRVRTAKELGPEILQTVLRWRYNKSGQLIEDVDRCHSCHRGVDSGYYADPVAVRDPVFRTHPSRDLLFASHPVERFGCTPCHLGQGRATERTYAHSRGAPVLMPGPGQEAHVSWHMEGDHYWEEPMLKPGVLWRTRIDDETDELEVTVSGAGSKTVKLGHRTYELFADLRREIERRLNDAFPPAAEGPHEDRFAVNLVGNRVVVETRRRIREANRERAEGDSLPRSEWGVRGGRVGPPGEMRDPEADQIEPPKFKVAWTDPALGRILGFSGDLSGASRYGAPASPEPRVANQGNRGTAGLQVPANERERLVLSAPFVESSCLRCHTQATDFRPLFSVATQSNRNAERQIERARWTPEEVAEHAYDPPPPPEPEPESVPDLAPTLTEGRYLFRKLNCTGCHILDGFPGNRNAGPGLDAVRAKVSPEFLYTWMRYPRLFRPGTRMPNMWPLPLDPETKEPLGRGTEAYRTWERERERDVTAMVAYLIAKSQPLVPAGYGNVEGATAEEGKLLFDTLGCQGCHPTDPDADRPGPFATRDRDVAPSLSNIGLKTNADWLTWWIENPARYWSGTKMPVLRLTRPEAASVARYLMTLRAGRPLEEAPEVLRSGAMPEELVARGKQLVADYGCYGCHQMADFEAAPPIAPELNGLARKDVTTLDFGYAVPDHHEQTWETFVTWKLDSPRIYTRDRIQLRMGDFDLSPHEIRALLVFLKGTQEDRIAVPYDPQLSERGRAILAGRQIVEDYNCRGCHSIEGRGGDIRTFFPQTPEALALAPPSLRAEGFRVQPEWLYSFLRVPYRIRPWIKVRMPTFNFTNDQATAVTRYFAALDGQEYPFQRRPVEPMAPDRWAEANRLFAQLQCQSCHVLTDEIPAGVDPAQLAPNLERASERLRADWMHRWLENPEALQPNTRMPAFFTEPFSSEPSPYSSIAHGTAQENIALLVELLNDLDRRPPVAPAAPTQP